MTRTEIEAIVLGAMRNANLARDPSAQLEAVPGAAVFGSGSPLDSLGLVALLLDIEDALRDRGVPLVLSDDRAVSQKRSPFRTVTTLADYIELLLQAEQA